MTDRSGFRYALGAIVIVGGLLGLAGLYFFEVPAGNRDALVLALGIVLGWGGAVVNFEYGGSSAGKKAAEAGIKTDAPQPVVVEQPVNRPVPVDPK